MKITKQIITEKEEIIDILCNKCGQSCRCPEGPGFLGLTEAKIYGSYFSDPLEDFTGYKFALCEKCLDKLFKEFKIPVETWEYNFG